MAIDTISNYLGGTSVVAGASSAANASAEDESLGRNDFLTLLVTQLQNQDPLNPMESQDFSAQLAQFSSLEQLFDVNESLATIHETIAANEKENALDYVGMEVKAAGNTLYKDADNMDQGSYYIEDDAEVIISIYDSNGLEIRQIQAGFQDKGEHDLDWDGRDENGNIMDDGIYTYGISASDQAGSSVHSTTYSKGKVTGVSSQYGQTYLIIGERLLEPDSVLEASLITDI
jgi:flagellar basal-body rod modification protein FlgD